MNSIKKSAFTLVELIIVITILAILATIGFMSFQTYTMDARDANRTTSIKSAQDGFEIYRIKKSSYPIPDSPITLTGGQTIIKQGLLGETVSNSIKLMLGIKDPKTNNYYVYSTSEDGKYYQLGTDLENNLSYNNLVNTTYAEQTKAYVKGNYKFDPSLPSLITITGSINTSSGIFDPNVCFVIDGGTNLVTSNSTTCTKKKEMNLKDFDSSLVGYWDMESLTGTKLKDLSGNGNDGTFSGTSFPTKSAGKIGGAYYFGNGGTNNNTGFVQIQNNSNLNNLDNGLTVTTIVKIDICSPASFIIIKTGPKVDINGYQTGSIDYSNKIHRYNWGYYLPSNNCTNDTISFYSVNQIPNVELNVHQVGIYLSAIGNPSSISSILNKPVLKDYVYHILTSTVDSKGNTRKMYIDGIKVIEFTVPKDEQDYGIRESNGDLFLGSNVYNINGIYTKGVQFNGIIDDIKIYNRALSDDEILQQAKIAGF